MLQKNRDSEDWDRIFAIFHENFYSSSIRVVSGQEERDILPSELEMFSKYDKDHSVADNFLFNAIDPKDKSITIKIRLDRNRDLISKEIDFLLNLLEEELDYFKPERKTRKVKPRWQELENYLKVYRLKKEHPKWSWSQIAKELYPKEVKETRTARRMLLRKAVPLEIKDVIRKHWKQGNYYINEGGWRDL